ncbi:tyrosine-type recombinase/integrase [Candidatus Saccharibacteria bacterium]|nr:tyrosine-type recombinase/integrase [Candidatus Saccharibacteria bacterium]
MREIKKQVLVYLDYCEKVRMMTSATMNNKRNVLQRFINTTSLDSLQYLTNEVFNKWVTTLVNNKTSPSSINTYNAVIMAMVRYYREMGLKIPLKISLINKLKEGDARRKYFSINEIERAISYANPETELMIRIMFETGMRIAELTRLKLSDFNGRRIQFIGKGRKPREVYIKTHTLCELREYINNNNLSNGYLFATLNGEPPTTTTIRKKLKKPFRQAGFDDFYPHALRHSFATNLQLKGASVEEIKEMIGHESIATTERYLHGFEGHLEELFNKYG